MKVVLEGKTKGTWDTANVFRAQKALYIAVVRREEERETLDTTILSI